MTEWQTMDTCPDDTAVLVYACGCYIAHFNTAYGCWIGYDRDTADTANFAGHNPPTHWMPLPAAPE